MLNETFSVIFKHFESESNAEITSVSQVGQVLFYHPLWPLVRPRPPWHPDNFAIFLPLDICNCNRWEISSSRGFSPLTKSVEELSQSPEDTRCSCYDKRRSNNHRSGNWLRLVSKALTYANKTWRKQLFYWNIQKREKALKIIKQVLEP